MNHVLPANNHHFVSIRTRFIMSILVLFGALLIYRLILLQILQNKDHILAASRQHSTTRMLTAARGNIYYGEQDREAIYPVAINSEFSHVYIVPRDITNVNIAFGALWPLVEPFGVTSDQLEFRLSKENDIYEPLVHKLTDSELEPFTHLGLAGIAWEQETWRYYPEAEALAHITGFVGMQESQRIGQYGLEGYFEEELRGASGLLEGKVDSSGRLLSGVDLARTEPKPGIDLVLTINRTLQSFVCNALQKKVEQVEAQGGSVVIIAPETGAVLALCAVPVFDPNTYNEVDDLQVYRNQVVADAYEPGSIFKPFTMAAAINEGTVTAESTYIDEGKEKIGRFTIRNSDGKAHGEVDMATVLNESLNTGAIYVQRELGNKTFREYMEKFGFGRTTDIELGNELAGNISSLYKSGDIFAATASFGQGITATPIQLVMAYAAIANGGKLVKPYIIAEKRSNGVIISKAEPQFVDEVLSIRAATIVSGMLTSVVRNGHAKTAGVDGYYIAGKTGTAQVAEAGEYGEQTIHSFAGFGPIDQPVFAMLVKLDHPQIGIFSSATAAPLFGDIARFLLQYYKVPPSEDL